jgi:PAS domain S-box-containing protein
MEGVRPAGLAGMAAITGITGIASIADALPHPVWVLRPDGEVAYASRPACAYAGSDTAATRDGGWLPLVHPDDADMAATLAARGAGGETATAEVRVRRYDGTYLRMAVHAAPLTVDDGTAAWVATLTDVEDRRRAEADLHTAQQAAEESGALIDAIQALAPVGFAVLDTEYRYVRINSSLAATNGSTPEELVGRTVPEVLPWLWPRIEPLYRDVIAKRATFHSVPIVGESPAEPGVLRHWLASYYPIVVRGDLIGMGVLALDVSERHRQQQRLEEFHELLESSSEVVALVDTGGRLRYLNRGGRVMLGIAPDADLDGVPGDSLIASADRTRVGAETETALAAHGRWEGTIRLGHRCGGPDVPVDAVVFHVVDSVTGDQVAVATVARDARPRLAVTAAVEAAHEERHRLLGELVMAADDERRRIAADVHDDTIQELAAVDMRLQLLRRRLSEGAAERDTALVDGVRSMVHEAAGRLRQLLFDLEPPSMSRGIVTVLDLTARRIFDGTDVEVTVTGSPGVEPDAPTLSTLYRVAREALNKTYKHAGASRVHVDVSGADGSVTVTIDDDGTGPGQARSAPGHLGVVSMRERVELARGRFEIGERPGGGTRVRMTVPLP